MSDFTQDFFTSRRNYSDGNTRIGEKDRLWYDSITNTIRIGDGVTPGGILISGGSGGGGANYLNDLIDVTISGLIPEQVLKWNGTNWVNSNQTIGSLNDIGDVDTVSVLPTAGQALVWNGSTWAPGTVSGGGGGSGSISVSEIDNTGAISNLKTNVTTIRVNSSDGLGVVSLGAGVVKITSSYGNRNLDGGAASTVYGTLDTIDAGSASTSYGTIDTIDAGGI